METGVEKSDNSCFYSFCPSFQELLVKNILTSLDCCQEIQSLNEVYTPCFPHMFYLLKIYFVQFKTTMLYSYSISVI